MADYVRGSVVIDVTIVEVLWVGPARDFRGRRQILETGSIALVKDVVGNNALDIPMGSYTGGKESDSCC